MKAVEAQRFVVGLVDTRPIGTDLARAGKAAEVVATQREDNQNPADNMNCRQSGKRTRRPAEATGTRLQQQPADQPDDGDLDGGEEVVGQPVPGAEARPQPSLYRLAGEPGMGQAESGPGEGIAEMGLPAAHPDAPAFPFMRAMVAVVLWPGSRSISTTRPPWVWTNSAPTTCSTV